MVHFSQPNWLISTIRPDIRLRIGRRNTFQALQLLESSSRHCIRPSVIWMARELQKERAPVHSVPGGKSKPIIILEVRTMWTKPDFTEMRFGFEITMYIGNR